MSHQIVVKIKWDNAYKHSAQCWTHGKYSINDNIVTLIIIVLMIKYLVKRIVINWRSENTEILIY